MDYLDDELYTDYLDDRNLRSSTIRLYKGIMREFCQHCKRTPSQILAEAKEDQLSNVWKSDRRVNQYQLKYLREIKKKKAVDSQRLHMTVIRTFLLHHDITDLVTLNIKEKDSKGKVIRRTTKDIPNQLQIADAIRIANVKYKAMIMLMASSGMANTDVRNLSIEEFYKSLEMEYTLPVDFYELDSLLENEPDYCPVFNRSRVKTGIEYTTFCTPECLRAIINYMKYENRFKPFHSPDELIFHISGNPFGGSNLERTIRGLNDMLGYGYFGKVRFMTSHTFRKYFTSTLYKKEFQELVIEWFLGHKIPKTKEAYFKTHVESHREKYKSILHDLTFIETVKIVETDSKIVKDLAAEVRDIRKRDEEKTQQIADLNAKLQEYRRADLERQRHKYGKGDE